jgi:hypothetical protein
MITYALQIFGVFLMLVYGRRLFIYVLNGKTITIPLGFADIDLKTTQVNWDAWIKANDALILKLTGKEGQINKKFFKFMAYFRPIFMIGVGMVFIIFS